jgi:predicted negative regulator of RcsB-dependent stress response
MRALGIAIVAAVLLATVAGFGFNAFQETSVQAYRSGETGFNHEEAVNNYGRQG